MKHTLKNITYNLVKMEKALVFQILEQDESWTATYKNNKFKFFEFKTKNGILIRSQDDVNLRYLKDKNKRELWLVGWLGFKTKWELEFENNTQRDKYYNLINEALKEWRLYVQQLKGMK